MAGVRGRVVVWLLDELSGAHPATPTATTSAATTTQVLIPVLVLVAVLVAVLPAELDRSASTVAGRRDGGRRWAGSEVGHEVEGCEVGGMRGIRST
jgi:hypothetical protein